MAVATQKIKQWKHLSRMYLQVLKNSVPVNCTMFNLQRLKIHWLEFRNFLASLPDNMEALKTSFLERLALIKIKIDAIEGIFSSLKEARYAFQEASGQMKIEIEAAILKLQGV